MVDENSTLKFYKHSNKETEIGWDNSIEDRNNRGPNLQQLFSVFYSQGLKERAYMYEQEGGWSGDLQVVHRRLFKFQNEISRHLGDSGTGGPLVTNVYEVIINSTEGWAQYLSLILKGPYDEEVAQKLTDLNFAPKHSYLAKDDRVPRTSSKKGLWLDDFIEFPPIMPKE